MAKTAKHARTSDQDPAERAKIEAARGIVRDEHGVIQWTPAQKKERKAHFQAKIADFKQRIKNAQAEIDRL
jgi:hypothetical protein